MKIDYTLRLKNFIFIALGVAIYAFGFVNFNMTNHINNINTMSMGMHMGGF